jgi:hypothetical protein
VRLGKSFVDGKIPDEAGLEAVAFKAVLKDPAAVEQVKNWGERIFGPVPSRGWS